MGLTLERIRRLTWCDLVGVGQAVVVLCRVALGLRRSTLPELLEGLHIQDEAPTAGSACIERATQLVRWAHRLLPLDPHCLLDSLAAAVLVRRQGFSVPLIIGVDRQNGTFQAHAWLGSIASPLGTDFQILYASHAKTDKDLSRSTENSQP